MTYIRYFQFCENLIHCLGMDSSFTVDELFEVLVTLCVVIVANCFESTWCRAQLGQQIHVKFPIYLPLN